MDDRTKAGLATECVDVDAELFKFVCVVALFIEAADGDVRCVAKCFGEFDDHAFAAAGAQAVDQVHDAQARGCS